MSNSLLPYPCRITIRPEGLDYEFTAAAGAEFLIYFSPEYDFFDGASFGRFVVSIGFRPKAGRATHQASRTPIEADPQVFITVAWAIENYLQANPHYLVTWVCSRADNQEAARLALFDRKWRLLHRYATLPLRKVNLELAPREFMSIVYRTDNRFRTELEALLPEE